MDLRHIAFQHKDMLLYGTKPQEKNMQCHQSWGFMGNLVLLWRNTGPSNTTGTNNPTNSICLWKLHQGITANLTMIYCCLKMLHVALFTEVVSNFVSNRDSQEWFTVVVALMPRCTPSMESSCWEFPVRTGVARLQAWRVAAWCVFFCSRAHITDLQTCVKFMRAVNVTYCKRWKCLPCHSWPHHKGYTIFQITDYGCMTGSMCGLWAW